MRVALLAPLALALALVPGAVGHTVARASGPPVEVVVTIAPAPLALAKETRGVDGRTRLHTAAAHAYLARLDRAQDAVLARVTRSIPGARVGWRYRTTLDGFALVVPRGQVDRLGSIPGVAKVWPSVRYRQRLDRSPGIIGAPKLWGPDLSTAGQGMKIGIIDVGVDPFHPFFDPTGYSYPPGFPKGDTAFTTPKVIVARAFPPLVVGPAVVRSPIESKPYDPDDLHGTHVAGIAAGNNGVVANYNRRARTLSGVAPKAWIGNYRALTVPTPEVGTDGNAPEIAAAIEAAVNDGMDVINLSLGEPEIEPSRDLVVRAIEGAAAAGVVPVVSAGNDFEETGAGSVQSPGSAPSAITVAAASKADVIAPWSSGGPTPVSLQLKPDVTAPGMQILSSVPQKDGLWAEEQGTSMAAPHVAGAAALLRERHPAWSVAQIKSALAQTGDPVFGSSSHTSEVPSIREGGGMIDLPKADAPLLFARPVSLSFGLVRAGSSVRRSVTLADAGGGAGTWSASVERQTPDRKVAVRAPSTVSVPGAITVTASVAAGAVPEDVTGFVALRRGSDLRRIPFWVSPARTALAREPRTALTAPGTYRGTTKGRPSLVSVYRYPRGGLAPLPGPERVYRVRLRRPVANFGVAVVGGSSRVQPRITFAGDESHLVGYTSLPVDLNPYTTQFGRPIRTAAVIRPRAGAYDVVFDEAGPGGAFTFRYWVNDVTPPRLRLLTASAKNGGTLVVSAVDLGAGVDPASISAQVDGKGRAATFRDGRIAVDLSGLAGGRHDLRLVVSDYQESKNMENVPLILPNTGLLTASFTIS